MTEETVMIVRSGLPRSQIVLKVGGRVSVWCPDFAGWHYMVQFDHRHMPWVILNDALLCLLWPDQVGAPVPARLAYMLPSMLERGSEEIAN